MEQLRSHFPADKSEIGAEQRQKSDLVGHLIQVREKNVATDCVLLDEIELVGDDFVDSFLIEPHFDEEAEPAQPKGISEQKIDPSEKRNSLHLKREFDSP